MIYKLERIINRHGDCYTSFVVRADSEEQARMLVFTDCSHIECPEINGRPKDYNAEDWLSAELSSCVEIEQIGPPEIIDESYWAAYA